MTNATWSQRVTKYVDELEQVAETIEMILSQTRIVTTELDAPGVNHNQIELVTAVGQLESMVASRETLLAADDAPSKGTTLVEKLASSRSQADTVLMNRCQEVSAIVSTAHQHALSLFVCQYHLANFSGDIVRMLSGTDAPPTYRSSAAGNESRQHGGGRLFNDAA
ncbi:hypothetical protein CA13_40880 [Planctomycetes bacterium CA13]|uniref:FlgN protein n=1 Tax=Novipirellula herctigrandis TaxID=2527986 RepID=A0A5C5Z603_9BACT|nr:hypothetical protein CA13_40880 [Planctomycetes bacterium CA13]